MELTLRECCGEKIDPKPLPDAAGFWIKREPLPDGDSLVTIDRNDDGELCHFHFPRRPFDASDRGEWYGPFRLVPASPVPA